MESNPPVHFKSKYSYHDAFYLRGELLRPGFGQWDCYDPVAHIIFDLAEAQSALSDLFLDSELACLTVGADAFKVALDKRHDIARKLLAALENREGWPDPDLGRLP